MRQEAIILLIRMIAYGTTAIRNYLLRQSILA